MRKLEQYFRKYGFLFAAFVTGAASFLVIFSSEPLHFTNIGWMMYGYQGHDIIQHQSGWMFFRNSSWTFPLGNSLDLGYPGGTPVSFTDSIPIAAIIFKLFSPFFGNNFQYFGLSVCFCLAAQGLFGAALVYYFTKKRVFSVFGSLVFIFTPMFLERCFHHTALASHWLLLAGLSLYFYGRSAPDKNIFSFLWCILLCLAEGIHPYLFIMISGVFLLFQVERLIWMKGRNLLRTAVDTAACGLIVFLFGYCLGLYGKSLPPSIGFGRWNMNLNALFNPGGYNWADWSLFLDPRPYVNEIPDGTMYLGLPALIMLPVSILIWLIFRKKRNVRIPVGLLLLLLFYTVFAFSNVITFDEHVLFEYGLPDIILNAANIFRASLRFFFIPYYCILLFIITMISDLFQSRSKAAVIACLVFVCFQIMDLSPVLRDYHEYYEKKHPVWEFSDDWQALADSYDMALSFDEISDRVIGYWLAQNHFKTNINISAPIHLAEYWKSTEQERNRLRDALTAGTEELMKDTIYIISDITGDERTFPDEKSLESFLTQVRNAYAGQADLLHVEDFARSYWILCPVK